MKKCPFRPRNDMVLIWVENLGKTRDGKLALPDTAFEGKLFHVAGVGPIVKDLEVGDQVLMVGQKNAQYFELPTDRDFIIIEQKYVVLVDRPFLKEEKHENSEAAAG